VNVCSRARAGLAFSIVMGLAATQVSRVLAVTFSDAFAYANGPLAGNNGGTGCSTNAGTRKVTIYGSADLGISAAALMTPANRWAEADFSNDFTTSDFAYFGDGTGSFSVARLAAGPVAADALAFTVAVPEPGSLGLAVVGFFCCGMLSKWRCRGYCHDARSAGIAPPEFAGDRPVVE